MKLILNIYFHITKKKTKIEKHDTCSKFKNKIIDNFPIVLTFKIKNKTPKPEAKYFWKGFDYKRNNSKLKIDLHGNNYDGIKKSKTSIRHINTLLIMFY